MERIKIGHKKNLKVHSRPPRGDYGGLGTILGKNKAFGSYQGRFYDSHKKNVNRSPYPIVVKIPSIVHVHVCTPLRFHLEIIRSQVYDNCTHFAFQELA